MKVLLQTMNTRSISVLFSSIARLKKDLNYLKMYLINDKYCFTAYRLHDVETKNRQWRMWGCFCVGNNRFFSPLPAVLSYFEKILSFRLYKMSEVKSLNAYKHRKNTPIRQIFFLSIIIICIQPKEDKKHVLRCHLTPQHSPNKLKVRTLSK